MKIIPNGMFNRYKIRIEFWNCEAVYGIFKYITDFLDV